MQYLEFHWWLSTPMGRDYLHNRHPYRADRPCEAPYLIGRGTGIPNPYHGRIRHFCAATKACGGLRREVVVMDEYFPIAQLVTDP